MGEQEEVGEEPEKDTGKKWSSSFYFASDFL
jgi:hypothetical protein